MGGRERIAPEPVTRATPEPGWQSPRTAPRSGAGKEIFAAAVAPADDAPPFESLPPSEFDTGEWPW
jgi:hypothetical protein